MKDSICLQTQEEHEPPQPGVVVLPQAGPLRVRILKQDTSNRVRPTLNICVYIGAHVFAFHKTLDIFLYSWSLTFIRAAYLTIDRPNPATAPKRAATVWLTQRMANRPIQLNRNATVTRESQNLMSTKIHQFGYIHLYDKVTHIEMSK